LRVAKDSSYYALFYLALTSGLRPGELIALHWSDITGDKVPCEAGKVHVRRTLETTTGKVKDRPKTRRARRIVDIPADTVAVLAEYRQGDGIVFPSAQGTLLSQSNIRRSIITWSTKAKVTVIRPHDLRHTYAGMAIANGMSVMRLARQLGHVDAGFTLRFYGHVFERYQPSAAASLTELLGKSPNGIASGKVAKK
jgi:integrase